MADLLGSILGSMQKPPSLGEEEKKKAKELKARLEKQQDDEKQKLESFRKKMQKKIQAFIQNGDQKKVKFPVMEKVFRAIVHEVSDTAGLASFSFGQEEDDRYVMLWKKEFAPSDDELLAYRKGEEWDPERAKEVARQKELEEKEETQNSAKPKSQFTPNSNYMEKYEHLIGRTAAKDAAVTTTANRSYGFVPSENKRDKRTVEQVLADSRAKKKQKTESGETGGAVSSDAVEPQTCEGRDGNAVSSDAVEPQTCEASDGNSATASS